MQLYLASSSTSRQSLLSSMGINFTVIDHAASEVVDPALTGADFVAAVARQKIDFARIPPGKEGETCFALTADSLCTDSFGTLYGKPRDRQEAIKQLKALRSGGAVITAFCLDKRSFNQNVWHIAQRVERTTITTYELDLPDHLIETYLDNTPGYLHTSGSLTVEGYGAQFMKSMNGSYTGALGLPLAELRAALEELGLD